MIIRKREGKKGVKYSALVRTKGHSSSKTFNSLSAARKWGKEEEDRIKAGPSSTSDSKRSLRELLGLTMVRVGDKEGSSSKVRMCCMQAPKLCECTTYAKVLAARSLASEEEILFQLNVWSKYLGHYALKAIEDYPPVVSDARDKIKRSISEEIGHPISGATINRYLAALSGFFRWAVEERHIIKSNPVKSVSRGKEPRSRVRYLSDEEREALFTACQDLRGECPALYPLVVVACYSGMRQGELLALRWVDVDLTEGWAYVRTSKNDEPRQVPLAGPALEALINWKHTLGVNLFGRVFNLHAFSQIQRQWYKALANSGVKDFRWHDLRHTSASYIAMSNGQLTDIAAILGHKTLAMSLKYAHLSPARKQDVMANMAARFGSNGKA